MKRQRTLIIIIAAVFALIIAGYFAIVRPFTAHDNDPEETTAPETEEGEDLGVSNRFFMFTSLTREDVASIYVHNEYGEFTFVSDEGDTFKLEGHDNLFIDKELFAKLVSVSTYTLSKTKINSAITEEKLEEFGLLNPQAYWIITAKDGTKFKVDVGDKLLTGGGYYCKFEGRNSVYVLGSDVGKTILVPVEKYITPVLVAGVSKDNFFDVTNFTVFSYADPICRIKKVPKKDQKNPNAMAECIMDYPTNYHVNSSLFYDTVYDQYVGDLLAEYCYKIDADDSDYEEVGLDVPAHTIAFEYGDVRYMMMFSEQTPEKTYYVVSNLFPDVIGVVEAEDFKYLETTLLDWVDSYLFQEYITDVSSITVSSDKVDAKFMLSHFANEKGEDDFNLTANGKPKTADNVLNFRQYYKSFLAIAIYDYVKNDEYCKLSEEEIEALAADTEAADLTFTCKKLDGETITFRFYRYSTRHSLVTINGVGEFYILTDLVQKIENDTVRILNNETVTAFDKS